MPEEPIFRIEDYRGGAGGEVPCPHCGRLVPSAATRCRWCGVHFHGRADDFAGETAPRHGRWQRIIALAILITIGLMLALTLAAMIASFFR